MQGYITLIIAVWGATLSTVIFILDRVHKTPRLRISIGDKFMFDLWDRSSPLENIVVVSITNVGAIEVLINNVWFQSTEGRLRGRLFARYRQNYFWKCSAILDNLPKVVEPRREIHFTIPANEFYERSIKNMTLTHVRLVVTDSTGKNYRSTPLARTLNPQKYKTEEAS